MKQAQKICQMTVKALVDALESGDLTSTAITQACLDRITEQDGDIHAFLAVYTQSALAEAKRSDQRRTEGKLLSKLDGIPVALKDNILVKDKVSTCASQMLKDFVSPYDATVTEKIKAAGMPILGKLNMDEYAMGSSNENSAFGVCRNPWALQRVPGGSSGGVAAAVAAGMVPVALGSDTGGSIRQPASFCGVAGVKPAYGTVSRYGLVAFGSSLDQIGPITKTAEDAALMMEIIAGYDTHDATSDQTIPLDFSLMPSDSLTGTTIGMPEECFGEGLSPAVNDAIQTAVQQLKDLGATITTVSIPSIRYALSAYYVLSSAEASSNLARFDGIRYGYRTSHYESLDELYRKSREEGFGLEVKRRIMLGTFALSSGYQDQYYLKAQQARDLLRHEYTEVLQHCDAVLTPVAPTVAFRIGAKTDDPMEMYMGDLYTVTANLTGMPALSVPCGTAIDDGDTLPVGMSLLGAKDSLQTLLSIADTYEKHCKPNAGLRPYEQHKGGSEQ